MSKRKSEPMNFKAALSAEAPSTPTPTHTSTVLVEVNNNEKETELPDHKVLTSTEDSRMDDGTSNLKKPRLPPLVGETIKNSEGIVQGAMIPIPRNRIKPLKENWESIYRPIVEQLKLQCRYNTKTSYVEVRSCKSTTDRLAVQRAQDFVRAFALGFTVGDAFALVRIDELYLETFKVTDVKTLKGDHLARAIGRIAGTGGKNKHTIENATKTRIVMADQTIHILGSFQNCRTARRTICAQIMGTPNSKIHGTLKGIADKMSERL